MTIQILLALCNPDFQTLPKTRVISRKKKPTKKERQGPMLTCEIDTPSSKKKDSVMNALPIRSFVNTITSEYRFLLPMQSNPEPARKMTVKMTSKTPE